MRHANVPFIGLILLSLAGCTRLPGGFMGSRCDELGSGADARKVEAFLATGARFEADTLALAAEVEGTCASIAGDLGLSVPSATSGELQVEATCTAVAREIRSIVDASLPAGASLELVYEAPVCSFTLDAMAECVARCDASVRSDVEVRCTEGRLVGRCTGSCSGECRLEGHVACEAECRGTCTGGCSGRCFGACDGACSAHDADGNCVGTCHGTCHGSCEGSCSGTCEGSCVSSVEGRCEGSCAGRCDVDFEAPRCEGEATVEADAHCEAACDAEIQARAECTEPSIGIYTTAEVDPAAQARLATLVTSLRAHYPRLLSLHARLGRVAESGAELVVAFEGAAGAASRLGMTASACFAESTMLAASSVATVDATFAVSIEVSASVTAHAEAR